MPHSRIPVRPGVLVAFCLGLSVLGLAVLGLLLVPAEHARAAQTTLDTDTRPVAQGEVNLAVLRRQMRQFARQQAGRAPALAAPSASPNQTPGISGRLVAGDAPVANTTVTLHRYRVADSGDDSEEMTATTSTTGTFVFANPPTTPSGYAYYVEFGPQTSNPNLAYVWNSRDVNNYVAGQQATVGTLDVANVPLVAPPDNATVSVPVTFQWTPRARTTDRYVLYRVDLTGDLVPLSAPLGYVNQYTLTSLSGIRLGEPYFWGVFVDNTTDNGSFGLSQPRNITFVEAPAQSTGTTTATAPAATGTATSSAPAATGTPTPTATTGVCQSGTVQINIQNFAFVPESVTVCQGATVRWTNLDTVQHTSTSDTGVWDSGLLSTGQSFSFTFNTVGTYPYHCTPHPNMRGVINVVAATTTTATPTATGTAEATGTATAVMTGTPTVEATGTATAMPTAMMTGTATAMPTAMMTGTATAQATGTATAQATGTATAQATGTATAQATRTATLVPTGTATATATAQPTRTATLQPTGTATPRPTGTAVSCGGGNLCAGVVVVRAFIDFGCDGFFNRGTDYPLYGSTVTATLTDGTRLVSIVDENGNALISGINLAATGSIQVSIDSPPLPTWVQQASYGLAPCGNSPTTLTLTRSNFGLFGVAFTDFRFGLTQ